MPQAMGKWLAPSACLVAGGLLVGIAAPHLASAVAALPGGPAAFALSHDQTLGETSVQRLIDSRRAGLAVMDAPRLRRELAGAELVLVVRSLAGPERQRHLDQAEAATDRKSTRLNSSH